MCEAYSSQLRLFTSLSASHLSCQRTRETNYLPEEADFKLDQLRLIVSGMHKSARLRGPRPLFSLTSYNKSFDVCQNSNLMIGCICHLSLGFEIGLTYSRHTKIHNVACYSSQFWILEKGRVLG